MSTQSPATGPAGVQIDLPLPRSAAAKSSDPRPRPPGPARYCAVPHINIFQFFMVCYTCPNNGG